jgi:hypothetical protein
MKLVRLKEFAENIGLPTRVVRGLCNGKKIPNVKIGHIIYVDMDGAKEKINELMNPTPTVNRTFLERIEAMRR